MTDAKRVASIERRHELALLDQLLEEKRRPVPAAPQPPRPNIDNDPALRLALITVMQLLATTYPPETRGGQGRIADVVPLRTRHRDRSLHDIARSPHAAGGSL